MTLRQHISTVRSSHRLLSGDNRITDRAIASEIRSTSIVLIKRETNLRRLWSTDAIYEHIPCLEMIEVPISECCDYVDPCTVSRSKYKLPRISEGNYQYLIQGVWSINAMSGNGTKFIPISINRYMNLLNLSLVKNQSYFWIVNGYLYTNNNQLQTCRIAASFEEDIPAEIAFPNCDCGTNYTDEDYCKNPLDKEYKLPGYLQKQVYDLVSQKLLGSYFRLKEDMTSDNIDSQAVNTKPTN